MVLHTNFITQFQNGSRLEEGMRNIDKHEICGDNRESQLAIEMYLNTKRSSTPHLRRLGSTEQYICDGHGASQELGMAKPPKPAFDYVSIDVFASNV